MKHGLKRRIFGIFMSLVMLFSSVAIAAANENVGIMPLGTVYHANQKLKIENNVRVPLMLFNGVQDIANFAPAQVSWTNPATSMKYQAYCINPAYPGYGDMADYGIDIEKFDNSCIVDAGGSGGAGKTAGSKSSAGNTVAAFLEGAVNYGFPTVDAATLLGGTAASYGVSQQQLDYAAYLATKMAIWSGIHDNYKITSWSENTGSAASAYPLALKKKVVQATRDIYSKAGKYTPHDGTSTVTFTAGEPQQVGDKYEVSFTIANTGNNVPGTEMYVELKDGGTFPEGLQICDDSGKEYSKTTTSSGNERYILPADTTQIKVIVPDPGEAGMQVDLRLYAQQRSKILLYGRSTKGKAQNYVLAGNFYDNPVDGFAINKEYDTPGDSENPGDGKLKVIKLDARDNATPLAGVTFDCYNSQGQLIDTGTTDESGVWEPNIPGEGTYTVIERSTGNSYQLTEPTTLIITVPKDGTATATFRDYPTHTVTPEKEDAETGEPIPGVQLEIVQIDGKGAWRATGKTDADGKIVWEDVPDGTYLVREVSTVEGYILDQTPQYVTVRNGQASSMKFLNSKFPGLTITKIDQQTGEVVTDPATFKVEQVDGSYTTTVTTENGVATLKNLPVGTYKITEVTAPEGYALGDCPQTVYLGKDKNVQVVMKNLKKPVLTIEKIDGQTGDSVPGTKFEIKKSDGTVIGTVTTGADGKVTVGMKGGELGYLDPDVYTVTEVFVPEPYVLTGEHQDIRLNAGDSKSLLFANLEMPSITVDKYDEETGEKLPGAQFAIYEQADTARPVVEGMTDENGKFTSGYLKPGTYVVKELNPPPGYMFSDKTSPDRVIVAKPGDGEIIVKVDNIKLPELTIKKIDSVTKEPIAGVVYEIKEVDDTSVQPTTATTDENGTIVIPGLKAGTYEITEISTPKPYILNSTPQRVKLEAGDHKTLMFENIKYPTLIIEKTDYTTNKGIPNTTFKIEHEEANGSIKMIGTFKTDKDGRIKLPYVEPGWYIVTETIPAQGYQKPTNPVTRIYLNPGDNSYLKDDNIAGGGGTGGTGGGTTTDGIEITSGNDYEVVDGIVNYPLNSLVIKKADANTGEMLDGATFEVFRITGETSGQNGKLICTATTDNSGVIVITGLEAGAYAVRETKAPNNYIIAETDMQTVNMKADGTSVVEVVFRNYPYGAISINKVDGNTKEPLEGAEFTVTTSAGAAVGDGRYITDANGNILIPNLKPGSYVITEVKAPDGYMLSTTPKTVQIGTTGETLTVNFTNYKKGGILIRKYDADNKALLGGATFKVERSDGTVVGTSDGLYTTDESGTILIPDLEKGTYVITEIKAPEGYALSENPSQTIKIDADKIYTVDFYNQKKGGLLIRKFDADSKKLLAGATFKIERPDGTVVGTSNGLYTTDESGAISLPELAKGTYIITEIKAPDGYALSDQPSQTIQIDNQKTYTVDFYNKKQLGVQIIKLDSQTKQPLAGAEFEIWKTGASSSTSVSGGSPAGVLVGTYTTNSNGVINVVLEEGTYEIIEKKAPEGYQIDSHKQDIVVKDGEQTSVTFTNTKIIGLEILKIDAVSKKPLQGAIFDVSKPNGEHVGTYSTDSNGYIMVSGLASGTYVVTEKEAPYGYALDSVPQTVEVKAGAATRVTFTNSKLGGIVIKKLDSATEKPIEGCEFLITTFDGTEIGTFTTDRSGLIHLPNLPEGTYIAKETKAPRGYNLAQPKTFTVKDQTNQYLAGSDNNKTITIYNDPLGVSQIIKTDAVTGEPVAGATYVIAALNSGAGAYEQTVIAAGANASNVMINGLHTVIGEYTTSENGIINISNLPEGWYTLQEKTAPEGYERDATIYNFQITGNGVPTIIRLTNKPIMGRIALTKLSQNYNNNTGWDSGTPLAGAVYNIVDKNGVVVDKLTTGADGTAISNQIKVGTYTLQEVKAPDWYGINPTPIKVTIQKQGQVVSVVAKDPSINLMVGIKKTSDTRTCGWGDTINYYITGVGNESNVALDKFTVHDKLPDPKAAQIKYFDTGMWSKKYNFKVAYTTNLNTAYTYLPGLYTSDKHNHIDLYAKNLGLRNGEYVTQIKMEFQDSVAPGFKLMEAMSAQMIAGSNLTNGYQFTNYADVTGRWHDQVVTANSHWTIQIYAPQKPLPKTGY